MREGVNKLESIWEKHSVKISIILSAIIGVLYYFEIVVNLRKVLSDAIAFSSIVIGINGVFITLVISIKHTPVFKRLNLILPNFERRLFSLLKSQVMVGLTVVLISLVITMLPPSPAKFFSSIGIAVWSFFFILMSVGSYFTMNLVTNIILANNRDPKITKKE